MATKQELLDLIENTIKDNSQRTSSTRTTASMLKQLLGEIVDSIPAEGVTGASFGQAEADARYHTRVFGEIKMYWGNYFNLPKGWALCDGSNGTPDMKGKIPLGWSLGWGDSYGDTLHDYHHVGKAGGTKKVTLEDEQIPSHGHRIAGDPGSSYSDLDGDNTLVYSANIGNGTFPESPPGVPNANFEYELMGRSDGTPTRGLTSIVGDDESHENRQPYCVMMYIMYIGETAVVAQKVTGRWDETGNLVDTNLDDKGILVSGAESNYPIGFKYIAPAEFYNSQTGDNTDPSQTEGISTFDDNRIVSNLGFIPEGDNLRGLERWIQIISGGDDFGFDEGNFDGFGDLLFISRVEFPSELVEGESANLQVWYYNADMGQGDLTTATVLHGLTGGLSLGDPHDPRGPVELSTSDATNIYGIDLTPIIGAIPKIYDPSDYNLEIKIIS